MSTLLPFHALRSQARALAAAQPITVHVDAFVDRTHLDGPRFGCLFQVPAFGMEWQEAGEAETAEAALENLSAALVLVRCRLRRMMSEFFAESAAELQNFSHESSGLSPQMLIRAYQRADTAAQLEYARHRAYGHNAASTEIARRARFMACYHEYAR